MKYKTLARALWHGAAWAAVIVIAYSEPLGAWLDEHYPIGGKDERS